MITLAILSLLVFVMVGVLSIIPSVGVPDWMSTSGPVASVFQAAGSMGAWFPVALVSTVLLSVCGIWLAAFGIKGARIVISLLTGGGGSAS